MCSLKKEEVHELFEDCSKRAADLAAQTCTAVYMLRDLARHADEEGQAGIGVARVEHACQLAIEALQAMPLMTWDVPTVERCTDCGSTAVEYTAWLNVNTHKAREGADGPFDFLYCNDCQEEVGTTDVYGPIDWGNS